MASWWAIPVEGVKVGDRVKLSSAGVVHLVTRVSESVAGDLVKLQYSDDSRSWLATGQRVWVTYRGGACYTCGEEQPKDGCLESRRPCGHHCNCSWVQDLCHWCGVEFGEVTS